jgi:hypothetical protein
MPSSTSRSSTTSTSTTKKKTIESINKRAITPATSINSNELPTELLTSNQISLQDIVIKNGEVYEQDSDNKYVVGIVTHLVRNNQSNQSTYFNNFYNNKKKEQSKNKPFDRMIMFVDVNSTNGQCGVIIYYSALEAQQSLTLVRKSEFAILPGMPIAINEPSFNGLFLGTRGDMPILTDLKMNSIIPLDKDESKWMFKISYPIIPPADQVVTRAFIYDQVYIKVNNVQIEKSNCTGRLCDRTEQENANSICFCFSSGSSQALVITCKVFVFSDEKMEENQIHVNHKFQSYQFTLMLTDTVIFDMTMTAEETIRYRLKLRNYVSKYISHVNQNGGWSIIGWYRNARKTDAHTTIDNKKVKIDEDKNTIISEYVEPHIVKLIPLHYPLDKFEEPPFTF